MPLRKTATTTTVAAPVEEQTQLPLNAQPASEATVKPKRGRKAKAAAAPVLQADPQPEAQPEPQAEPHTEPQAEPVAQPAAEPASTAPLVAAPCNAIALPPLDAPAVNADEPAISYKIDFSDRSSWHASTDGGETKAAIGSKAVAGSPVDLILQISKARRPSGFYTHDYRLRLAFYQPDGQLAELNLTAINVTASGELYVTSPVRSLVGALLAISDSEDDMVAFAEAARFTIKPGTGRGVFIETDLASQGRWVAMASPTNTTAASKSADGLMAELALIKHRFRAAGLLLTSQAVSGDADSDDVIDTTAEAA